MSMGARSYRVYEARYGDVREAAVLGASSDADALRRARELLPDRRLSYAKELV